MGQDNQDSLWQEKGVVGSLWPVLVHRASPTSMPGLGRTTWGQTGNQLQGLAGHLGAGPRGHHCTSFRQQEQAQPRSVGKWRLVLTPGTEGLIQGIKDKEHLRHPGKLDFTEQLLSLSSPCNSYTDLSQRCWSPSLFLHHWCPARPGWMKSHVWDTNWKKPWQHMSLSMCS